jgi:hypothetical protein
MAILAVTALISYERAKAESLGLSARGGLMERGERMFLLGVAFLSAVIFVPVLWILFTLVSITAIARFVKVWNAASGRDEIIRRRIEAWREGRVDSRFRAWREGREFAGRPRREPTRARTTAGAPVGRWRARRQETPSSRSGRTMRERRRAARRHPGSASPTATTANGRVSSRRTPPASGTR